MSLGGEISFGQSNLRHAVENLGKTLLYSSVLSPPIVCMISSGVCNAGKKELSASIERQRRITSDEMMAKMVHAVLLILQGQFPISSSCTLVSR